MKKSYHTIRMQGKVNEQELATFLTKNGQGLLPMVDLIEQSRMACDQLIDVTGRAVLQAVLQLSAAQVAGGPQQQGKRRPASVVFYGRQAGQVMLSDRKLQVERPRLRTKGRGRTKEVEIPAYTAMQDQSPLGEHMLDTLLHGVSTRNYKEVIPQMAETIGVSKSSVSRQAIEASEAELEALLNRRFDDLKLLIIYMDGVVFGEHTMIGAVGVDAEGRKHVLGIREGATENATVVMELLQDIVARGVDPKQKRLFIIDGSKSLRAAINAVFGADQPVQRCRAHKLCGQPGRWKPRRAWRASASWPSGWIESIPRPRPACSKGWRNASPSTGWVCRPHCSAAWQRPTSLKARTPECASEPAASPTGKMARW